MSSWGVEIEAWMTWLQASGASRTTLRLRRWQIEHVSRSYGLANPWAATTDQLVRVVAAGNWAPETRKGMRAAVRGFYRWGLITGRIERDPAALLPSVRVPRALPKPTPMHVARVALDHPCRRTRLMVALALFAGLRRAEVAAVRTDDLVDDLIGRSLRIVGKGSRERLIPLDDALAAEIAACPRGYLFPGREDGHLSAQHVGVLLRRALDERHSGHTLRHRFATSAYDATRDLRTVQELLGHASPTTTARYVSIPDGAMRAAVDAVRTQMSAAALDMPAAA